MGALVVEIRAGGEWRPVGTLGPAQPSGSLSHNGPAGRQVYQFQCLGEHSVLRRSLGGTDAEFDEGRVRTIATEGFEDVARLTPERPSFECWIKTDRMREPMRVRFRHER